MPLKKAKTDLEKSLEEWILKRHEELGTQYIVNSPGIKYAQVRKPLVRDIIWTHAMLSNLDKVFQDLPINIKLKQCYKPPDLDDYSYWFPIQTNYTAASLLTLKPKDLVWLSAYLQGLYRNLKRELMQSLQIKNK